MIMRRTKITRRSEPRPKANWTLGKGQVMAPKKLPKKRIRIRSKSMESKMREYRKLAAAFKRDNPECVVENCRNATQDVHHTRGRVGSLLTDWRYWLPVCRRCHEWIQQNPRSAREVGLLCATGWWNVPNRIAAPKYGSAK